MLFVKLESIDLWPIDRKSLRSLRVDSSQATSGRRRDQYLEIMNLDLLV